jgi:hypothetical protein
MLVMDDIARLWELRDERYAVRVVKHDHVPAETTKFLGQPQSRYPKKNWSSVMLLNNARCAALTPEYVNGASGLDLHRFQWLAGDDEIGELPQRWNHLVGYDPQTPDVALAHRGRPILPGGRTASTRRLARGARGDAERRAGGAPNRPRSRADR